MVSWYTKRKNITKEIISQKYKTSQSLHDYIKFSNLRNECKSLFIACHKTYIDHFQESVKNKKQFWKYVNNKRKHFDLPNTMTYNNTASTNPQNIANLSEIRKSENSVFSEYLGKYTKFFNFRNNVLFTTILHNFASI